MTPIIIHYTLDFLGILLEYFIYSISSLTNRPRIESYAYNVLLAAAITGILFR